MFTDLLDMMGDETHLKIPGIVIGEVIDNYNEEKPACVQVKLHDRTKDMNVTGWARVAMPFAGNKCGFYSFPDIGDEVILAFCHGDIDMPIVIGSLYTKDATPPDNTVIKENTVKMIRTKGGHTITLEDKKDAAYLEIATAGKAQVKLDDKAKTITVQSGDSKNTIKINAESGEIQVKADKKVSLECGSSKIVIEKNKVSIESDSVTIKAKQSLKAEGQQVEIKGQQTEIKGQMTTVKADSKLDITSSGMTNIKGSMVKLN